MKQIIWAICFVAFLFLLLLAATQVALAQEKTYTIPESKMTEQQKKEYIPSEKMPSAQEVHQWAGIGEEVGKAVNGSLVAVTTQANNFAQTPVGKLTVFVVVWKVLGTQFLQVIVGAVELLLFAPIFIYSYRRTCMDRKIVKTSEGPWYARKKTYEWEPYDTHGHDMTPRIAHSLALGIFIILWSLTIFAG